MITGNIFKRNNADVTRRVTVFFISLLLYIPLWAQFTVRFEVYDHTSKPEIFLAGSFNDWNPGDIKYRLGTLDSTHKFISIINIPAGKYLFKFTHGDWSSVESTKYGFETNDRTVDIKKDTTLKLVVEGWVDDYLDLSRVPDTIALQKGLELTFSFLERNIDTSYKYATFIYERSKELGNKKYETISLHMLGEVFQKQGNPGKALELFLQSLPLARSLNDSLSLSIINQNIGDIFVSENDFIKAKYYYFDALKFPPANNNGLFNRAHILFKLGIVYFNTSQLDSSQYYAKLSLGIVTLNQALILLGDIQKKSGNKDQAMVYYQQARDLGFIENKQGDIAKAYQRIAREFTDHNQPDSGFYYSRRSFAIAHTIKDPYEIVEAGKLLVTLFERENKLDSAFIYQRVVLKINDSLFSGDKERQIHNMVFNEQLHEQEITAERQKYRSRNWIYALSGGFVLLLLTAVFLIRNNRQKKEANTLLQKQKEKVESTLSELKTTQIQLIQSEKMASLGELTAGIAHEIQNPLNFVNNFSEVNTELIDELEQEIDKGNLNEVKSIARDIKENEEKINHHGKRADAIVKGMLQHSRSSNGVKEPTDINALADEYSRLAYHGLRAKDKEFNAILKADYDPGIGNINIIPQDIGRVILNLITNAFYVVNEKRASTSSAAGTSTGSAAGFYEPTVTVSTVLIPPLGARGPQVQIKVADNGGGIPQKVLDKIFQPFFTTKPTGQGTGLGLSLSYDIIRAHGGEIKVETKEGESSTFIIELPV